MKVVITGGSGFLGLRLAGRLLEIGELTGPDGAKHQLDAITLHPWPAIAAKGILT